MLICIANSRGAGIELDNLLSKNEEICVRVPFLKEIKNQREKVFVIFLKQIERKKHKNTFMLTFRFSSRLQLNFCACERAFTMIDVC